MKIPPKFREFHLSKHPGPWPGNQGLAIATLHFQFADSVADYMDLLAAQVFGEKLGDDEA